MTFLLTFEDVVVFWPFNWVRIWRLLFLANIDSRDYILVTSYKLWVQNGFFVGYQLEGWFFRSPKFRRFSIKSGSLKTEQFNCPVLHKRYFCNSQHGHNEEGVAEMPMVRCKPAAGWFPTPRVPRANMGDPYRIDADGIVTLSAMRELELLPVLSTLPPIRRWHTFWHYEGFF